ncbi:MAG: hypothetical protein Ct9H300mP11_26100 [Chloroflexota bacterium]|nr:MAG: hypothetical protein Ct9H300mP11_26100 [Chloroflexota bacterium]
MIAERASDHGVTIGYVNTVGGQDDLVFDGGSIICDRKGDCSLGPLFRRIVDGDGLSVSSFSSEVRVRIDGYRYHIIR